MRQGSGDLATELHDMEMVPVNLLGVLNPKVHPTLSTTEDTFSDPPIQSKPQQLSKQLSR